MRKEAIEVKERAPAPPPMKVTMAEIAEVKRDFIQRNLTMSPEETGALFGRSPRWVLEKVKDGVFIAADSEARRGESGLQASRYVRITIESIEAYRRSITIESEQWAE